MLGIQENENQEKWVEWSIDHHLNPALGHGEWAVCSPSYSTVWWCSWESSERHGDCWSKGAGSLCWTGSQLPTLPCTNCWYSLLPSWVAATINNQVLSSMEFKRWRLNDEGWNLFPINPKSLVDLWVYLLHHVWKNLPEETSIRLLNVNVIKWAENQKWMIHLRHRMCWIECITSSINVQIKMYAPFLSGTMLSVPCCTFKTHINAILVLHSMFQNCY